MTKSYATFAQLTDPGYLGAGQELSTYQTTLQRMLESASEEIDHFTYRHFDTWEGIQYYDGAGTTLVPDEDILSISTIYLDFDGSGNYATLVPASDYLMYPLGGPSAYPKLMLKMKTTSSTGYWASGIRAGVKITGVFGHGDGNSATPYHDSGITGTVASTTLTTLTLSDEGVIQAGNTIRLGTEQMYVQSVTNNGGCEATVKRGVNGTTATNQSGVEIYIYDYPGPVTEACLLLATGWWKQRENPATYMSGDQVTGSYVITKDMEKIITQRLAHHIKRKII